MENYPDRQSKSQQRSRSRPENHQIPSNKTSDGNLKYHNFISTDPNRISIVDEI